MVHHNSLTSSLVHCIPAKILPHDGDIACAHVVICYKTETSQVFCVGCPEIRGIGCVIRCLWCTFFIPYKKEHGRFCLLGDFVFVVSKVKLLLMLTPRYFAK